MRLVRGGGPGGRSRRLLAGLLAVALLALVGCGTASTSDPATTSDVPIGTGRTADLDFTSTTLAGDTFDGAELAGRPVVLWWWAPWCPTCIAQSTNVSALADRHEGAVSVVGVGGLDTGPDIARVADTIPHVVHLVDPDGAVWRHFGVQEQSTYTVIAADGEIISDGYLDDAELNDLVDRLVSAGADQEQRPTAADTELPGLGDARDPDAPSALDDRRDPAFPPALIDPEAVLSGGPPPDGIPSIDYPAFQDVDDVSWLDDREPVLSLTVGGETRAYPIQVLTWHEIVNDTVGGVPVAVTYCPLCNSGVAFERRAAGRLLSFGTSGLLYEDNLVMYDRQTESLWPQLTGRASIGVLTGTRLTAIPMGAVTWGDFRAAHPTASVLSRNTGHDRPYGTNPYVGYDDESGAPPFALSEPTDPRLPLKARVVGIDLASEQVAIPREALARRRVTEVEVGGVPLVVLHEPGQASALDTREIREGRDIGTVAVYRAEVAGTPALFRVEEGRVVDVDTGSAWNVLGRAVSGPRKGDQLPAVQFLDTFWFAWVAFQPDTRLVR